MAQRKQKGTALLGEDGTFTFTPYQPQDELTKSMVMVKRTTFGVAWEGKKTISLRFNFPKHAQPPLYILIDELMKLYQY